MKARSKIYIIRSVIKLKPTWHNTARHLINNSGLILVKDVGSQFL